MGKDKKVEKENKGTKKPLLKLRKKKIKLEDDPNFTNQKVEGADSGARKILKISKEHKKNKAKLVEKKGKLLKRKKRRAENELFIDSGNQHINKDKDSLDLINSGQALENGSVEADSSGVEETYIGESIKTKKAKKAKKSKRNANLDVLENNIKNAGKSKRKNGLHVPKKNKKMSGKSKRKDNLCASEENSKMENFGKVDAVKVDEISSVDEDCSRGMKKWLIDYKESRPGLKILQERIDEFITTYEAQQEQERKEREALAAEGGWTVVVHQKGRKKTTDTESGITVGSVAQAAVLDNMTRKKHKEVPLDFYRFQKREAQRSEVMMLRSKFEQDKKRIQQLRAARKFRPY
ncbi:hypothetical protein Cni_G00136 [Canna indica]|uniref:Ribosomal RNA-processing protein 7 C-terminal domain-containing protein n=1 Tax=Canna indica TaxID=4628 RepID=A0AAQ3JLY2_9LILI|nr:hypothetical protein Cni_G00136 [Canna indica]